jgi:prepilin-type N-terminal cleavage/methylation domain-containing protein
MPSDRNAFTLIELLVVITIITILMVVVVLTLNPAQLLAQSRDASRLSDMQTLNSALDFYRNDQGGSASFALGSSSTLYVSIPDPLATSTSGDQCQGLGLPALPSGWTYHCPSASAAKNTNGQGWIPVDLRNISSGSPLGSLPIDPSNQTSTWYYYTYATNGLQFQLYSHFESSKDIPDEAKTAGYDPASYKMGTNVNIAPFAGGMTGYWPMNEGTGATTADYSGYGNTGTLEGGTMWGNSTLGPHSLVFDGSTGYVQLMNNLSSTMVSPNGFTLCAWVDPNPGSPTTTSGNYYEIMGNPPFGTYLWTWPSSPNNFGTAIAEGYSSEAMGPQVIGPNASYEVCAVQSPTGYASIYVNGQLDGPANQSTGPVQSPPTYPQENIGATQGENFFNGSIGFVRIYERMLTPQEIAGLYQNGS